LKFEGTITKAKSRSRRLPSMGLLVPPPIICMTLSKTCSAAVFASGLGCAGASSSAGSVYL